MEVLALLIPIMALSIPIVAILTRSRRQGQVGSPEQQRRIRGLEEKVRQLEESLDLMGGQVHDLEDKQRFLSRLLEDKHG